MELNEQTIFAAVTVLPFTSCTMDKRKNA